MKPTFSTRPGAYERQLIRYADNPLFPPARRNVLQIEVTQAQRRDREEAAAFHERLRALVQRAIDLPPQADSEVVLKLKEDLDQAYEQACGLGGDLSEIKTAVKKLLDIVMRAVWCGAGDDAAAQVNLREEEAARVTHFALLEYPLIADIIRPDSPIAAEELLPTLLSESGPALAAAFSLFDANQLALLCQDAREQLRTLDRAEPTVASACERLADMERHLAALQRQPPIT